MLLSFVKLQFAYLKKQKPNQMIRFLCTERELNPHAFNTAPQDCVSTNFTTSAFVKK